MAIRFGVFGPQAWRMDLAEIEDPIEKYEAMTRAARAAGAGGRGDRLLHSHYTAQCLRPRSADPIRVRGRADVHPMSVSLSITPVTGCARAMGGDSLDGALCLVHSYRKPFRPETSHDACGTLLHEPWVGKALRARHRIGLKSIVIKGDPNHARNAHFLRHRPDRGGAARSWGRRAGFVVGKQLDRLDRHCRAFVALSPFVLVGTWDSSGACDVSPSQAYRRRGAGSERRLRGHAGRSRRGIRRCRGGEARLPQGPASGAEMPWVDDFSQGTVRLIGALEVLGAIGVIAPRATGVLPRIAHLAAAGLAMVRVGGFATHIGRGEYVRSGSSRPCTAPPPSSAGSSTGRPRRSACPRTVGRWTA